MISCQVSQVVQMSHCHIVRLHTSSQDELKRCIQAGWHNLCKAGPLLGGFFQFVRIFQASKGESQAILIRQKAVLSTQSQVLNPFLSPQSSISPQFSILNSSVFNPQFSIINSQFSVLNSRCGRTLLHSPNLPVATSSASRQKKLGVWSWAVNCTVATRMQFAQFTQQGKVHNLRSKSSQY